MPNQPHDDNRTNEGSVGATRVVLRQVKQIAHRHLREGAREIRAVMSQDVVAEVLKNGDVDERDALCNIIGEFALSEYAALLVEVLLTDRSPCVRHDAAFALGRIADPSTRAALEKAARMSPSVLVRHEATLALGGFEGVADVLRAARRDPSPDVAESAEVALAQFRKSREEGTPG